MLRVPPPAQDGSHTPSRSLAKAIGGLALTGLTLNVIIGSSVFGLPSVVGGQLGASSPLVWILAAVGMAPIVASFAEVASRFTDAGGQYLYVRKTFGRLAGIEMAWLTYLVRLTAAATNANLFVIYLAEFFPGAKGPVESRLILAAMLIPLAIANYRGVGSGLNVSTGFTIAKLVPLGVFVVGGLGVLLSRGVPSGMHHGEAAGAGGWLQVILLLVFAYGGFESALLPLGEAKNPRRDAPIALFAALGVCALLYTLVQTVVIATLPDPGASDRPLAAAAATFLGRGGATLMALGALISVYGYLAGSMLNVPRLSYAMAEQGDLPPRFGAVHPRFRTPHVSVLVFATLTWALASVGSFLQNLSLSAVSRLLGYGAVCVALIVLRRVDRREPGRVEPARLRIPFGETVAILGLAFTAILILRMSGRELAVLAATLIVGLVHWRMAARPRK